MYVYTYHERSKKVSFSLRNREVGQFVSQCHDTPYTRRLFCLSPSVTSLSLVKKGRFLPRANDRPKPGGLVQLLSW